MKPLVWNIIEAAGFTVLSIGVGLIYVPAGIISAGISILLLANGHSEGNAP